MVREIEVVPYNHAWKANFEAEAGKISLALGDNCTTIHHIGSTAVPGLAAKPVIDMIPVVKDLAKINEAQLIALGYVPRGELGMPFRRFYNKGEPRAYHLHIWEIDNPEIEKHLLFREYLRAHSEAVKEYASLKQKLATEFKFQREHYTGSKDSFIKDIIQKSGFTGLTIVRVLLARELEAYHRIKRTQIFDPLPNIIYDPNHLTMKDENHYHYVLMCGVEIVAIAQVEFLDQECAILRALATDEPYKNHGYGAHLLTLMERWIKQSGKTLVLMHAAPNAEHFYRKRGYVDMEFDEVGINPKEVDLGKIL